MRIARALAALLAIGAAVTPPGAAMGAHGIADLARQTRWGETEAELLRQFDGRATRLPWRLDFGDSYADIVLRDEPVGGFRFLVYFQMDKQTGGLVRIQLERPRHGANPPAFRAALSELAAEYGAPDRQCALAASPRNGYQPAAERIWRRADSVIRAIFRDATLEASEGCFALTSGGPCGLTAQLLLRISPRGRDSNGCAG
jgi:hypothetical protein